MDSPRWKPARSRIGPAAQCNARALQRSEGARAVLDSTLGDYSYIERDGEAIYTGIGKFCAIAAHAASMR
jgi:hypothetical protein